MKIGFALEKATTATKLTNPVSHVTVRTPVAPAALQVRAEEPAATQIVATSSTR